MKLLVCGGRKYSDKETVFRTLDKFHEHCHFTVVVHGCATGADSLAGEWAKSRNVSVEEYPADWSLGRRAGIVRNEQMYNLSKPDLVIAFPGGTGTKHMIETAQKGKTRTIKIV